MNTRLSEVTFKKQRIGFAARKQMAKRRKKIGKSPLRSAFRKLPAATRARLSRTRSKFMKRFGKRIAALRSSHDFPATLTGVIKHHPDYIKLVVEGARAVCEDHEDAREFAKLYLAKDPAFSNTDTGMAALLFEVKLSSFTGGMYGVFMETIVHGNEPTFIALFEGKLRKEELERFANDVSEFCTFQLMVQAGQANYDVGSVSDLTILECTAIPGAKSYKLSPDTKGTARQFQTDKGMPGGKEAANYRMLPRTYEGYEAVVAEGGLSEAAFKVLYAHVTPDTNGNGIGSAVDHNDVPWLCHEGVWVPDLETLRETIDEAKGSIKLLKKASGNQPDIYQVLNSSGGVEGFLEKLKGTAGETHPWKAFGRTYGGAPRRGKSLGAFYKKDGGKNAAIKAVIQNESIAFQLRTDEASSSSQDDYILVGPGGVVIKYIMPMKINPEEVAVENARLKARGLNGRWVHYTRVLRGEDRVSRARQWYKSPLPEGSGSQADDYILVDAQGRIVPGIMPMKIQPESVKAENKRIKKRGFTGKWVNYLKVKRGAGMVGETSGSQEDDYILVNRAGKPVPSQSPQKLAPEEAKAMTKARKDGHKYVKALRSQLESLDEGAKGVRVHQSPEKGEVDVVMPEAWSKAKRAKAWKALGRFKVKKLSDLAGTVMGTTPAVVKKALGKLAESSSSQSDDYVLLDGSGKLVKNFSPQKLTPEEAEERNALLVGGQRYVIAKRSALQGARHVSNRAASEKRLIGEDNGFGRRTFLGEDLRLGKADKRVLMAFTRKEKAGSKKLETNGTSLDGLWMGGNDIAKWKGGKIHVLVTGRASQTIVRALRKVANKNDLAESLDEAQADLYDETEDGYTSKFTAWCVRKEGTDDGKTLVTIGTDHWTVPYPLYEIHGAIKKIAEFYGDLPEEFDVMVEAFLRDFCVGEGVTAESVDAASMGLFEGLEVGGTYRLKAGRDAIVERNNNLRLMALTMSAPYPPSLREADDYGIDEAFKPMPVYKRINNWFKGTDLNDKAEYTLAMKMLQRPSFDSQSKETAQRIISALKKGGGAKQIDRIIRTSKPANESGIRMVAATDDYDLDEAVPDKAGLKSLLTKAQVKVTKAMKQKGVVAPFRNAKFDYANKRLVSTDGKVTLQWFPDGKIKIVRLKESLDEGTFDNGPYHSPEDTEKAASRLKSRGAKNVKMYHKKKGGPCYVKYTASAKINEKKPMAESLDEAKSRITMSDYNRIKKATDKHQKDKFGMMMRKDFSKKFGLDKKLSDRVFEILSRKSNFPADWEKKRLSALVKDGLMTESLDEAYYDEDMANAIVAKRLKGKEGKPKNVLKLEWANALPINRVDELVKQYGKPQTIGKDRVAWTEGIEPFSEIMVKDEMVPHMHPKPHVDYFYASIDYPVPAHKVKKVRDLTESVFYDSLTERLTARCDAWAPNIVTLHLAKRIAEGSVAPHLAERMYTPMIMQGMEDPAFLSELQETLAVGESLDESVDIPALVTASNAIWKRTQDAIKEGIVITLPRSLLEKAGEPTHLKSLASKAGVSMKRAKHLWDKAQGAVQDQYPDIEKKSARYYQAATGIMKKMMKLKTKPMPETSDGFDVAEGFIIEQYITPGSMGNWKSIVAAAKKRPKLAASEKELKKAWTDMLEKGVLAPGARYGVGDLYQYEPIFWSGSQGTVMRTVGASVDTASTLHEGKLGKGDVPKGFWRDETGAKAGEVRIGKTDNKDASATEKAIKALAVSLKKKGHRVKVRGKGGLAQVIVQEATLHEATTAQLKAALVKARKSDDFRDYVKQVRKHKGGKKIPEIAIAPHFNTNLDAKVAAGQIGEATDKWLIEVMGATRQASAYAEEHQQTHYVAIGEDDRFPRIVTDKPEGGDYYTLEPGEEMELHRKDEATRSTSLLRKAGINAKTGRFPTKMRHSRDLARGAQKYSGRSSRYFEGELDEVATMYYVVDKSQKVVFKGREKTVRKKLKELPKGHRLIRLIGRDRDKYKIGDKTGAAVDEAMLPSLKIMAKDYNGRVAVKGKKLLVTFKTSKAADGFSGDVRMEYPNAEIKVAGKFVRVMLKESVNEEVYAVTLNLGLSGTTRAKMSTTQKEMFGPRNMGKKVKANSNEDAIAKFVKKYKANPKYLNAIRVESIDEVLGYKVKAGDKKIIVAFVKGDSGEGIKSKNLEIEGDKLTGPSRGVGQPLATRKGNTITLGDPQGNISQTWINAVRKAAKRAGAKISESIRESVDPADPTSVKEVLNALVQAEGRIDYNVFVQSFTGHKQASINGAIAELVENGLLVRQSHTAHGDTSHDLVLTPQGFEKTLKLNEDGYQHEMLMRVQANLSTTEKMDDEAELFWRAVLGEDVSSPFDALSEVRAQARQLWSDSQKPQYVYLRDGAHIISDSDVDGQGELVYSITKTDYHVFDEMDEAKIKKSVKKFAADDGTGKWLAFVQKFDWDEDKKLRVLSALYSILFFRNGVSYAAKRKLESVKKELTGIVFKVTALGTTYIVTVPTRAYKSEAGARTWLRELVKVGESLDEAVTPQQKAMSKLLKAYFKKKGVVIRAKGFATKGSTVEIWLKQPPGNVPFSEMARFPEAIRKKIIKHGLGVGTGQVNYGNVQDMVIALTVSAWTKFLESEGVKVDLPESLDEAISQVAKTINQQIGHKAFVMMGAKDKMADKKSLMWRIGRNPKGVTKVRVTLDPTDTYTIEFIRIRRKKGVPEATTLKKVSGIFVDMLHDTIENHTGLRLSLF